MIWGGRFFVVRKPCSVLGPISRKASKRMKTQHKAKQPPATGELSPDDLVTYALPKLLQLWQRSELTTEQMVGHLLQHQFAQEKRITVLERGASKTVGQ